uniref:Nuclear pore complex protein Nup160 n=1 Tax=Panagrolaimus sp. PS1159 TaxID=55785 RepID=A0AC35G646_9BILA
MDTFDSSELAFNRTYFAKKYSRTLKIPADAHIPTFSSSEVPQSSGCFNFSKNNLGFENRFILWRSDGPNLYLDEYSTDHDLQSSSLCINFNRANIIPGVKMFSHCGMLILIIPTQAAIHRIMVRLARDDVNSGHKSILAYFPRDEDLSLHWDCRHLTTPGTAIKAEINMTSAGHAFISMVMSDNQLLLVECPFKIGPEPLKETMLQESRRLTILWKTNDERNGVVDVASAYVDDDVYFFAIYKNSKIRVWSASMKKSICTTNVSSLTSNSESVDAETFAVKASVTEDSVIVTFMIQMADEAVFFVSRFINDSFEILVNQALANKRIMDFVNLQSSKEDERCILWAITREAFDPNSTVTTFQPYLLWRCPIKMNGFASWEKVQPAVNNQCLDELRYAFPKTLNAIKHRIFNGECYSFDVVKRALQVACKRGPLISALHNDWSSLVTYVDDYVNSGHFVQSYLTSEDKSSLLVLNVVTNSSTKASAEKFYESLLRYCDEFQEAGLQPLGLWYSPALDLIGVIQQCRFTIFQKGDAQMKAIIRTAASGDALQRCFVAANKFCKNEERINKVFNNDEQLVLLGDFNENYEHLCYIIRRFAEHSPIDEVQLNPVHSDSVKASFTAGFLSILLRHRLLRRFKFANLIMGITKLFLKLTTNERTASHGLWETTTRTHDSTILQISNNYRVMWSSLSYRLTKQHHRLSEDGSHRLTVGQALFQLGPQLVRRLDAYTSHSESNDDGSSSSSSETKPLYEAESEYTTMIREVIDGSITYCYDNEPFISELASALRLYQGIAYCIQGDFDRAFDAFNEVLGSIHGYDDALNIAISRLLKEPIENNRARSHSVTEYLKLIMDIFRMHNGPMYALRVGKLIMAHANEEDPILSKVYTDLFKLYLTVNDFNEAVLMIRNNPSMDERTRCLRELISTMILKHEHKNLVLLDYGELAEIVAEILEQECLASFLKWDSPVYQVAFSFYSLRYLYAQAARLYIYYSFRLSSEAQTKAILEKRCTVLATAVGAVQCTDSYEGLAFELFGSPPQPTQQQPLIRQMYTLEASSPGNSKQDYKVIIRNEKSPPIEGTIIDAEYLRREHLKVEARLQLLEKYESLRNPPTEPNEIASECIQYKLFDFAFTLIRTFDLDVYGLLEAVAYECIYMDHEDEQDRLELEARLDSYSNEIGELAKEIRRARVCPNIALPEWVTSNRQFVYNSQHHTMKPHWKILHGYLKYTLQMDKTNTKSIRIVAHQFLKYSKLLPDWLSQLYTDNNLGDMIFSYVQYGEYNTAFDIIDKFLDQQVKVVAKEQEAYQCLLPFTQIEQLIVKAESRADEENLNERIISTQNKVYKILDTFSNFTKAASMLN